METRTRASGSAARLVALSRGVGSARRRLHRAKDHRSTVIAVALSISATLVFHFFMTGLYLLPLNPVKLAFGPHLSGYIDTLFSQNWHLFAPDPINTSHSLIGKCRAGDVESDWLDVTHGTIERLKSNPRPGSPCRKSSAICSRSGRSAPGSSLVDFPAFRWTSMLPCGSDRRPARLVGDCRGPSARVRSIPSSSRGSRILEKSRLRRFRGGVCVRPCDAERMRDCPGLWTSMACISGFCSSAVFRGSVIGARFSHRSLPDSLSLARLSWYVDVTAGDAQRPRRCRRTRRLIDVETPHAAVFTWVLERLSEAGLVKGKTIGVDATTLEANAAMRSIERRDTIFGGLVRRVSLKRSRYPRLSGICVVRLVVVLGDVILLVRGRAGSHCPELLSWIGGRRTCDASDRLCHERRSDACRTSRRSTVSTWRRERCI